MKAADIPGISRLTIPEKILLVEDLWDGIHANESSVPIPPAHKNELDRRLLTYQSNPGDLLSLEQLQERIEARK